MLPLFNVALLGVFCRTCLGIPSAFLRVNEGSLSLYCSQGRLCGFIDLPRRILLPFLPHM